MIKRGFSIGKLICYIVLIIWAVITIYPLIYTFLTSFKTQTSMYTNMFGLPVIRTQTHEVSGIGSAIPAFVSLGVFKNYREALTAMVHKKDIFKPDRRQHEIYQRLYEDVYKQIYPKLAGIYEKMSDL